MQWQQVHLLERVKAATEVLKFSRFSGSAEWVATGQSVARLNSSVSVLIYVSLYC